MLSIGTERSTSSRFRHSTIFSRKKVRDCTNFKFVSEELGGEGSIAPESHDKIDNLDNRFLSFMTFSTFVL